MEFDIALFDEYREGVQCRDPPSSVVVYTQCRESGGYEFETRSGVMPQAALLKCGHNPFC